jgi:hypothetical protein
MEVLLHIDHSHCISTAAAFRGCRFFCMTIFEEAVILIVLFSETQLFGKTLLISKSSAASIKL